jgi:aminoglycoside phosphotransferase (APT) family kinase protein
MTGPSLATIREAIFRSFPELAGSAIRPLAEGWHSKAVEADGRLVFKFPKSAAAEKALRREATLLAVVQPRLTVAVPKLTLHEGPPAFSSHAIIPGEHLVTEDYIKLSAGARSRLGETLGRFYAELHRLDADEMDAAGAGPIGPWLGPDEVRSRVLHLLPPELQDRAEQVITTYERLPPDPCGTTYGFFDGHGWNMAFDHDRGRLNGIYDFGDSGFGPLHQEFIYSSFISPELTERIAMAYETFTGRHLDRARIEILTGYHRLWELTETVDDPDGAPIMMKSVAAWFTGKPAAFDG